MDLEDKACLVTGGSRGIGLATARLLHERGARVAVNGRSEATVSAAIAALGGGDRLVSVVGDVGTAGTCATIVETAVAALGGLDILVNSAGIYETRNAEQTDEAFWDATIDINLKGTFFCIRAALPALRAARGNVVNLSSDAGLMGYADMAAYCASKGGVTVMTKALAIELAPEVRVNCVCPGSVDTDMIRRDDIEASADPARRERDILAGAPLHRLPAADEIAHAIAYLASHEARNVTGSALAIDGGSTAGR
jgi:NAD(P)-dependent dehydrogenase (short-subunit alcohol dehydrogenase family)